MGLELKFGYKVEESYRLLNSEIICHFSLDDFGDYLNSLGIFLEQYFSFQLTGNSICTSVTLVHTRGAPIFAQIVSIPRKLPRALDHV